MTKGAGSKAAALAMAYKLLAVSAGTLAAVQRPRARRHVLAGVKFKDGIKVTDDDTHDDKNDAEKVAA